MAHPISQEIKSQACSTSPSSRIVGVHKDNANVQVQSSRSYQNASRTLGSITEDLGELVYAWLVAIFLIFEIKHRHWQRTWLSNIIKQLEKVIAGQVTGK